MSCVNVHSLPPEISVQYFLFITTVIIYNYICYSYLNLRLNCTQFPARHWLSELLLPLLCPQYHSWANSWTKRTEWKHAVRIPNVDSYTKWKNELFCAYLQKELTHNICVDFRPGTEMKSTQRPGRRGGENFKLQMQCSIYEWIIRQTNEEKEDLRLQRYIAQAVTLLLSVRAKQRELWQCTFLTVEGELILNRKINCSIHNVTL